MTTKLYWAYGSNLNLRQMQERCPAAVPLEALTVQNLVLRFRGVADVAYLTGAHCEGGLWAITPECERELDLYEGVGGGLYRKCYFDYADPETGETHKVLYYKMNRAGIMPPSEGYLDCIVEGYADFGIDTTRLRRAVDHAWRKKDMNGFMRYRWDRAGKPKMARAERIVTMTETEAPAEELPPPNSHDRLRAGERLGKKARKAEHKEAARAEQARRSDLPDVCLRADPDNPNGCRAVTLTERAGTWFKEHVAPKMVGTEWLFGYSTGTVAGLLQKKGLSVTILEKLKKQQGSRLP